MARGEKLLERMRENPRDWRIEETDILTVPAHRPIKPVYIEALVRFIDAVTGARS